MTPDKPPSLILSEAKGFYFELGSAELSKLALGVKRSDERERRRIEIRMRRAD